MGTVSPTPFAISLLPRPHPRHLSAAGSLLSYSPGPEYTPSLSLWLLYPAGLPGHFGLACCLQTESEVAEYAESWEVAGGVLAAGQCVAGLAVAYTSSPTHCCICHLPLCYYPNCPSHHPLSCALCNYPHN